ncbi:hypothetical protein BBP40_002547 [Aspergillus hancockii]|nr:hypothetical protein BBP40_002547 [Aspergillus hancockii]
MKLPCLTAALLGAPSLATRLYAASYAGLVTTLDLDKSQAGYQLTPVSDTDACGSSPSWLMPDADNGFLYCLNEAIDGSNATLTSFKVNTNGSLTEIYRLDTVTGPVHSRFYSAGGRKFFVVAHYSGSTVTSYSLEPTAGTFTHLQTFTYKLDGPGAVPDRQEAPHPHGVAIDPTGQFVLVPDLGADYVRVYHINPSTGLLEEQEPLVASPGSGPRHGVFWTPNGPHSGSTKDVRFYLASELNSHLTGYNVKYTRQGTLSFHKFYETTTYGGAKPPADSTAAEITISPGNSHVVISNRNDNTFGAGNDSVAVFTVADPSGSFFEDVTFTGLYPAYGSIPRQFEIEGEEGKIALALQNSHRVAVAGWDEKAGSAGPLLAETTLDGQITAVIWDF